MKTSLQIISLGFLCALAGCQNGFVQSMHGVLAPDDVYGTHSISLSQPLEPALIDIEPSTLCRGPRPDTPAWYKTLGENGDTDIERDVYNSCSEFEPVLIAALNDTGVQYRLIDESSLPSITVQGVDSYGNNAPVSVKYMPAAPKDFQQAAYLIEIRGPDVDERPIGNGLEKIDAAYVSVWDLKSGQFIGDSAVDVPNTVKVALHVAAGIAGKRCSLNGVFNMDCSDGFALKYKTYYVPKYFGGVQHVNAAESDRPLTDAH
jgi:hypothetical protein